MGYTQKLGLLAQSVFQDSSLNVGIGAAPSGTYKFEVTGTAKVSSTLLVSGALTGGGSITTSLSQATSTDLSVSNTSASNGAMAQISAINGGASQIDMVAFGSGSTGTLYGITKANLKVIRDNSLTAQSNGLAIGTDAAVPFYAFTNSVERMRISSTGVTTFTGSGNGIPLIIQDISAAITGQTAGYIGMSTSAFSANNGDLVLYPRTSATSKILLMGGFVGIGTSTPSALLTVLSTGASKTTLGQSRYLDISDNTGAANSREEIGFGYTNLGALTNIPAVIGFQQMSTSASTKGDIYFATRDVTTDTAPTERMRITSGGGVLIGKTAEDTTTRGIFFRQNSWSSFTNNGDTVVIMNRNTNNGVILELSYGGSVVGTISTNSNSLPSDRNFKKDITDISIGLDLITKLKPVHYRHKMDEDNEPLSNGIIAQQLEEALLECGVEKNSLLMLQHKPNEKDGQSQYWVDYTKMIPVLIKSIQEQQQMIEELKALIAAK